MECTLNFTLEAMMAKIEKMLSAIGNFVRILDSHRSGAVLFIVMQMVVTFMLFLWKK